MYNQRSNFFKQKKCGIITSIVDCKCSYFYTQPQQRSYPSRQNPRYLFMFSCNFDKMRWISNYIPTETLFSDTNRRQTALCCGSVQVPCCKYPSDSLLCSSENRELSLGEQLKVMRLRSGLTINEAAKLAEIDRCTLMNYEQGRTTRVKRRTVERLIEIYDKH